MKTTAFNPNKNVSQLSKRLLLLSWLALLGALLPQLHAGNHTWSGAVNGRWSNAGNWSGGGVPVVGESNLRLIFPAGAIRTTVTNDLGALTVAAITFSGHGYSIRGNGVLSLASGGLGFNLTCSGGTNRIDSPLALTTVNSVSVDLNNALTLAGVISGTGSLTKTGPGHLTFAGTAANTFSGGFTAFAGVTWLAKSTSVTALPGPVNLGTTNVQEIASLRLLAGHQIGNNAAISLAPSGVLNLLNLSDTIGSLTVDSGYVSTGSGVLTLANGSCTVSSPPNIPATIGGNITFLGASASIAVPAGEVDFYANILGNGSPTPITKTGPGILTLRGSNTFTGPFIISEGRVATDSPAPFGTADNGTTVANSAALGVGSDHVFTEGLTLSGFGPDGDGCLRSGTGSAAWAGNITLVGECGVWVPETNDVLTLSGAISGTGSLTKKGDGQLVLGGTLPNTFTGLTKVPSGRLLLSKPDGVRAVGSLEVWSTARADFGGANQMDDAAELFLRAHAKVNFNGHDETIGSLRIAGGASLNTGAGLMTLLGDVTAISGPVWAEVKGRLSLGGATRTFAVEPYSDPLNNLVLHLNCVVSDGNGVGGIRKIGMGQMSMGPSNSYSGLTWVDEGYLSTTFGSLGGTNAGTIVADGASLGLGTSSEPVTLLGTGVDGKGALRVYGSVAGPLNFTGDTSIYGDHSGVGHTPLLLSAIHGPWNLTIEGGLVFGGAETNTFTGTTTVNPYGYLSLIKPPGVRAVGSLLVLGSLSLDSPEQIDDDARITLAPHPSLPPSAQQGQLWLYHGEETVGMVEGGGVVRVESGALRVGAGNQSGSFSGAFQQGSDYTNTVPWLIKVGAGEFEITSNDPNWMGAWDGIDLQSGVLRLNRKENCNVRVHPGATLAGSGGCLQVLGDGGRIEPGALPGDGQFASLFLRQPTFTNLTVRLSLGGSEGTPEHDQLQFDIGASLQQVTLELDAATLPAGTNAFMIVRNDTAAPVGGQFNGLVEAAVLVSHDRWFRITYLGGDGNDVVLHQIEAPAPAVATGLINLGPSTRQITATGTPGIPYRIMKKDDLNENEWVPLGSVIADSSTGLIDFVDHTAAGVPQRFYRFVVP